MKLGVSWANGTLLSQKPATMLAAADSPLQFELDPTIDSNPTAPNTTPPASKRGCQMVAEACSVPCGSLVKEEFGEKLSAQCACDEELPGCPISREAACKINMYLLVLGIGWVTLPLYMFFSVIWDTASCHLSHRDEAKCCEKTCGYIIMRILFYSCMLAFVGKF